MNSPVNIQSGRASCRECHLRGADGFSLVDILIGLALSAVVIVAVISLFTTMGRSLTTQNVAADAQQVARSGVELMLREIRMAGFDPIGSAGATFVDGFNVADGFHEDHDGNIAAIDATNIAFTIDEDMDGRIDHCVDADDGACPFEDDNVGNELIAYRLNNGVLQKYRAGNASWESLTDDELSDITFSYYDVDGALTNDIDAIRSVEISLTIQLASGREGIIGRTYSTRVRCRNMGM